MTQGEVFNSPNILGMCKADRFARESPISILWRDVYTKCIFSNKEEHAVRYADEAVVQYKLAMKDAGVN